LRLDQAKSLGDLIPIIAEEEGGVMNLSPK
jgi:hypothetical protein